MRVRVVMSMTTVPYTCPRRSAKSSIPRTGTSSRGRSGIARTVRNTVSRPTVTEEPARESGAGTPGHRQSDCRDQGRRCGGASAPRQGQSRQLLGEGLCGAVDGVAEEAADPGVDQDRIPADCGIGKPAAIPGMHSTCLTGGTRAHRVLIPRSSLDADGRAHPPDVENIDTVQMREQVHHAALRQLGSSPSGALPLGGPCLVVDTRAYPSPKYEAPARGRRSC